MVTAMLPSLHRTWTIVQGEYSPLWLGIYAGTARQAVSSDDVARALWSLRRYPIATMMEYFADMLRRIQKEASLMLQLEQ
jgi:hypothetical protein